MKSSFLIFAGVCLFLISCKKDRSCACTVTSNESTTIRNQTAGTSFALLGNVITLVPPSDTTVTTQKNYSTVEKKEYNKVSKKSMRSNCPVSFQESDEDSYVSLTAGTSTVTTTKIVTKKYACEIK